MFLQPNYSFGCLALTIALTFVGRATGQSGDQVQVADTKLYGLSILENRYPRAFFFRETERVAHVNGVSIDNWCETFSRLDGIIGKVLDEEVPDRHDVLPFFVEYKRRYPDKMALLHFNGCARDPSFETANFAAGHWLYFNGTHLRNDLAENDSESIVVVDNVDVFAMRIGREGKHTDEIGICRVDSAGKPDWSTAEQVQLLNILPGKSSIRVRRGCYGTAARNWPTGSYLAAHVFNGPWGERSNLLWNYNFSTNCPRDMNGLNCAELLVQDLSSRFREDGDLSTLDGLELDLAYDTMVERSEKRGVDCNADGERDSLEATNSNDYGTGMIRFLKGLSGAMPNKLVLADGAFPNDIQQRGNAEINGIESEGWPLLHDVDFNDWSGGMNRMQFANQFCREPRFSYINHKMVAQGGRFNSTSGSTFPFKTHRLVMAVSVLTDSAFTFATRPPSVDGSSTIWDEMVGGQLAKSGWLGKSLGETQFLSSSSLGGEAIENLPIISASSSVSSNGNTFQIRSRNALDPIEFRIAGIPTNGSKDLIVELCIKSLDENESGLKSNTNQLARPRIIRAKIEENSQENKDKDTVAQHGSMSWVVESNFISRWYFRDVMSSHVDVNFLCEPGPPIEISKRQISAEPDVMWRSFENGIVIANPANHIFSMPLSKVFSEVNFERLSATEGQDISTNNGELVGSTLDIPAMDAIFLLQKR